MGRHWRIINENRRERQTSTFNKAKIIKIRIRNFENGKVEGASQVPVEVKVYSTWGLYLLPDLLNAIKRTS